MMQDIHMMEAEATSREVDETDRYLADRVVREAAKKPVSYWLDGTETEIHEVHYEIRERRGALRPVLVGVRLVAVTTTEKHRPIGLTLKVSLVECDFVWAFERENHTRIKYEMEEYVVHDVIDHFAKKRRPWLRSYRQQGIEPPEKAS